MFQKISPFIESMIPEHMVIPAAGILAGFVIATGGLSFNFTMTLAMIVFAFLVGGYNTLNAYFDRDIDKVNKPYRPIPSGRMGLRTCLIYALILYLIGLVLAATISPIFFFIAFLDLIVNSLYSLPPVRFKKRLFLTNLAVGIHYGGLPILAGWVLTQPLVSAPWILVALMIILATGACSIKDFEDYNGDRIFRIHTFPVSFGQRKGAFITSFILVLPFVLFLILILLGIFNPKYILLLIGLIWALGISSALIANPSENNGKGLLKQAILLGMVTELLIAFSAI